METTLAWDAELMFASYLELSATVDNIDGLLNSQVAPHRHLTNGKTQKTCGADICHLNQPGKAGHNKHGRVVFGMDNQLAGGEGRNVLVWAVGDGGVREGDGLSLGVALHVR